MSNELYILGIDQAKRSGWALTSGIRGDRLHLQGKGILGNQWSKNQGPFAVTRQRVIEWAIERSRYSRLLAVLEDHSKQPNSAKTALSLGESRGRWMEQLDLACIPYVSVPLRVWRYGVLGITPKVKSAAAKAKAVAHVKEFYRVDATEDEAEAICMCEWAFTSESVARLLKRWPNG